MIAPVFTILKNSADVVALLGDGETLRVFPWSEAPENVTRPYAAYGVYNGIPQNYLGQVPDMDNLGTQIDVWAPTVDSCNEIAVAIRDALEPHGHMTSFSASERDADTKLYRCRMDFDFFKERS